MKIRLTKLEDLNPKAPGIHPVGFSIEGIITDQPQPGVIFQIGESFTLSGINAVRFHPPEDSQDKSNPRKIITNDSVYSWNPVVDRIINLEEVCVSLEEAQQLNNTVQSSHAWVYNPYKGFDEFELKPVQQAISRDDEMFIVTRLQYVRSDKTEAQKEYERWKIFNADEFVAAEQINDMISKGHFYFAPLKLKNYEN